MAASNHHKVEKFQKVLPVQLAVTEVPDPAPAPLQITRLGVYPYNKVSGGFNCLVDME